MYRPIFRLLIVLVLSASAVYAEPNHSWDQLMQTLKPDKTVVVTLSNGIKVEGKLLDLTAKSITVKRDGKPQVIERDDVYRVRIANIRRKHMMIGMAIGAAAGAIISTISATKNDAWSGGGGANIAGGAAGGVLYGLVGGAVVPIGEPLYEIQKPKRPSGKP
jgi:hypothetical protein